MLIMRSGERQIMEGIERPNQEKIRTFGEKETYKYLGILETNIIKQAEMKEKIKRNTSDEQKISKPSSEQESQNYQKNKHLRSLILRTILKMDKGET